jgi:O-antigen/teichoic acid export membrane protein
MIAKLQTLIALVQAQLKGEGMKAINALMIRVFAAGVAFAIQLVMARWLGLEEYGTYAFVWTIIIIFAGASELGFAMSSMRFLPSYQAQNDLGHAKGFFRVSFGVSLVASTIIALLGWLGLVLFSDYVQSAYVQALYLALICFPLYTLTEIGDGTARSQGWINLALIPIYIVRPLAILALTYVLLQLDFARTAETVMIAAIIATWATGVLQVGVVFVRMKGVLGLVKPLYKTKEWLKVSLPIFAADGIYVLFTNADVLLVGALIGPDAAGLYFAAVKVATLLSLIPFAVTAAWGPKFSSVWATGNTTQMQRICSQTILFTFVPTALGALVLVGGGGLLLSIFGAEFKAAYPVLMVLLLGLVLRASTGTMDRMLTLAGQQNRMAVVFGATLIMNIVLNIALIPFFGIMGAAIATAASLGAQALGVFFAARKSLGIHAFILPLRLNKESGQ